MARRLMATWGEFGEAKPDMAERGEKLLGVGVGYLASVAGDGAPRLHPATPLIGDGRLLVFAGKTTVKYHNLRRDPRYALHAVLGESDEEFLLIGRVVEADDWASRMLAAAAAKRIGMVSEDDFLLELMIERAHWAIWEGLGTLNIRKRSKRWSES